MSAVISFGFAALTEQAEQLLVEALDLRPLELASDLAQARGTWKDHAVQLTTRAYCGGAVGYARFAVMGGGALEIGNLLCVPAPGHALPILGTDMVALGATGSGMIAADLSPTLPPGPERDAQLAPLAALRARRLPLPEGGELPAWCADWFSPHALYTRFPEQLRAEAEAAFLDFPRAFIELARSSTPRQELAEDLAQRYAGYAAAHRNDDKGLNMLAKIFGRDWAGRYLQAVLFPRLEAGVW